MTDVPRFAVVGRVNKGKSSIVATLAEDDAIAIDPRPGTTTQVEPYPVRVDGETLFELLDTPGFEDAPRALAWLRERDVSAAERPARVAEFVRAHEATGDFVEERRLLTPILEGASVLYVVDGTRPFRRNYEAEMEILRWTGRPGMALVNRIGADDHLAEWHRALGQYFRVVRDFDALSASFTERVRLLEAFRELRDDWRPALETSLGALVAQRRRRRAEAAGEIAELLADELCHVEEIAVEREEELDAQRDRLERSFHDALRAREEEARRRVEALYRHERVQFQAGPSIERPVLRQDLFAEETWRLLGLAPGELVAAGTVAGAAAGAGIDLAVGGASVMAGTLLGAAVGGGTALAGLGRRFARVRRVGPPGLLGWVAAASQYWDGARHFRIGPHAQPNFPWVLLDRALLHFDAVARRTHARRGTVALGEVARPGVVMELARAERGTLAGAFDELRRTAPDPSRAAVDRLARELERLLARLDPLPGDP